MAKKNAYDINSHYLILHQWKVMH